MSVLSFLSFLFCSVLFLCFCFGFCFCFVLGFVCFFHSNVKMFYIFISSVVVFAGSYFGSVIHIILSLFKSNQSLKVAHPAVVTASSILLRCFVSRELSNPFYIMLV